MDHHRQAAVPTSAPRTAGGSIRCRTALGLLTLALTTQLAAVPPAHLGAFAASHPFHAYLPIARVGPPLVVEGQVLEWAPGQAIVSLGRWVFVGSGPQIVTLDITDPAQPRIVAQSEILPDNVADLRIDGGRLYASAGTLITMRDIDLATGHLREVRRIAVDDSVVGRAPWLRVADGFLVAATGSGLAVFDLSTRPDPTLLYALATPIRDTALLGGRLWLIDNMGHLIAAPLKSDVIVFGLRDVTPTGWLDVGSPRYLTVQGARLLGLAVTPSDFASHHRLMVLDVSPAVPAIAGVTDVTLANGRLFVDGNRLTLLGDDRAVRLELNAATVPTVTGSWEMPHHLSAVRFVGDLLLATGVDDLPDGRDPVGRLLAVWSLPRAGTVHLLGAIAAGRDVWPMAFLSDRFGLYRSRVDAPETIEVRELADPTGAPRARFTLPGAAGPVEVHETTAYVVVDRADSYFRDLAAVDLTDVTQPRIEANCRIDGGMRLALTGALLASFAQEVGPVPPDVAIIPPQPAAQLLDVRYRPCPRRIATLSLDYVVRLTLGPGFVLAGQVWDTETVFDITDPTRLRKLGRLPGRLLTMAGPLGVVRQVGAVRVFDLTQPLQPRQLGTLDGEDYDSTTEAVAAGGVVFVAGLQALRAFDLRDPATPVRVGQWTLPRAALKAWTAERVLVGGPNGSTWLFTVRRYPSGGGASSP